MTIMTDNAISIVSTRNTSTTPLAAGASFVGEGELIASPDAIVTGITDQNGIAYAEFSPDGTNWDESTSYVYDANTFFIHKFIKGYRHFRFRFTNTSGNPQTFFRFHTTYGGFGGQLTRTVGSSFDRREDALTARILDTEFLIGSGLFQDAIKFHKFGYNSDIDTGSTPEDVWDGGGLYTGFPSSADTINVSSSSASDSSGNIGAHCVHLYGLDSNYNIIEETIPINGTSGTTSTNQFLRVMVASIPKAGSNEFNVGNVTIRHTNTPANIFSVIQPGTGQSRIGVFTIPTGYRGFLVRYGAQVFDTSSNYAQMSIYRRLPSGASALINPFSVSTNNRYDVKVYGAITLEEKTDIAFRVESVTSNNGKVSCEFDLVLLRVL